MSALDFWRKAYPLDKAPRFDCSAVPAGRAAYTEEEVWACAPPLITPELLAPEHGVLHITVQSRGSRHRSRTHCCHLWQAGFPAGSFYQLSDDAFVASPAFAFLQMAQSLTLPQLIALGDELCGLYSFDESAEFGIRQRQVPLLTVDALAEFLAGMPPTIPVRGADIFRRPQCIRRAQRALPFIVEGSRSPRETMTEMLLALPYRLGGYGCPKPEMNREIALSAEAAVVARRRVLYADLFWPDARLDLEFNGRLPHSGEEAVFSDRARTNALELMGYVVREITHRQLDDFAAFESIALHVAKLLGHRVPSQQRGTLERRVELRKVLFDWNRRQGRAK